MEKRWMPMWMRHHSVFYLLGRDSHAQSIPGAAAPPPAGKTWSWHSDGPWTQQKMACGKGAGRAPDLKKYTDKKRWAIVGSRANSLRRRACLNFCTRSSWHRADGDEARLLTWRKGSSRALASGTGDARGTHGVACRGSRTDCRERLADAEEGLMKESWQTSRESWITLTTRWRPVGGTTDAVRVMGLGMLEVCTWPSGPMWLKTKVTTDSRASPCSEEERMSTMGYGGD